MIFYHQSPFHFHPHTSLSWTPYILATSPATSYHNRCGNKKQKVCSNDEKSSIIYQDRNSRIQYTDDHKVEFSLDLPGIKASDIKVEIHDGVLKVEADRKHSNERTTKFQRSFSIKEFADLESEDVHASLQDGVLRITIPKKVAEDKEDVKSTPIPIEVEYPTDANESDSDTKIRFSVDLPGVSLSNVTLEVKNDTVSLQAARKLFEKESTTKRYFTIDTDKVDATTLKGYLVDGVLTLIGSKRVMPGPKQIIVSNGSDVPSPKMIVEEKVTESKEEEDMVIVETVAEKAKEE